MKEFHIYGAGGHGQTIAWIVRESYPKDHGVFFVETEDYFHGKGNLTEVIGVPVLHEDSDQEPVDFFGVIGIGQVKSSTPRRSLYARLLNLGVDMPPIISSSAHFSDSVRVRAAAQLMSNTILGPDVEIGTATIVNNGAQIEHGSTIGNFCHVSTGAIINGEVSIGDDVFIGSGAVVRNGVSIASGSFVPMGSIVTRDVIS